MSNNISDLAQLKPAPGSIKNRKRIGRGRGSGHGDTATKGHKGAQSRAGYKARRGFEGGQMPLQRRVPKRGFRILNRTEYSEVNLGDLARIAGDNINPETLKEARLIKGRAPVAVLGTGEVSRPLKLSVHRITQPAKDKVIAAGGEVVILPLDPVDRRVKKGPVKKSRTKKQATS